MNLRLTSSALALAAMTVPALADVTSEQVWQSWVDYYASAGYQVKEGNRAKAGDTLTISDLTITAASTGEAKGTLTINVPTVDLTDLGDGKVRTVYADKVTASIAGADKDGKPFSTDLAVDIPGNSTITSGAPEDMTHTFDYPTLDLSVAKVVADGKERPLPIRLSTQNTTGSMHRVTDAAAKYTYDMKTEKAVITADITDIEGKPGDNFKFDGTMTGLESSGTMSMPKDANIGADLNAALKSGMSLDGTVKVGGTSGTFELASTGDDGKAQTGSGKYDTKAFDLSMSMSQDGLTYQGNSDAVAVELTTSDMPFPIKYATENASFDIQMPVMKAEAPQPFKVAYSLGGLTLGEEIWGLFDPQAKLKRDPASMDLDLTGLMQINQDLFDQAAAAAMPAAEPAAESATGEAAEGEAAEGADAATPAPAPAPAAEPIIPTEVTINQFALSLLGASMTAEGALKAAEGADIATAPPVGQIKAEFNGVNGLLDTLGGMGVIPADQVTGVRMMLGLFTKPGAEGEDKLTTDLEFKEGGTVFANGQQVR